MPLQIRGSARIRCGDTQVSRVRVIASIHVKLIKLIPTFRVIAEKVQPPKEFSLLSRTADTDQKAWRKRQIAYKLSKRGTVTQAVTDIILCSKLKIAPDGFKLAGDINGVLICYKTGAIPVRLPPPVPGSSCEVEQALNRLNLHGQRTARGPVSGLIWIDIAIDRALRYCQLYSKNGLLAAQLPLAENGIHLWMP